MSADDILYAPISNDTKKARFSLAALGPATLQQMWDQQNLGASGAMLQQMWQTNVLLGEYQGLDNLQTYSSWPPVVQGLCGTSLPTSSSSPSLNDWQAQTLIEGMLNDRGMID